MSAPQELPPRLKRKRGAPPTRAYVLQRLRKETRLNVRAGFRCRGCGERTTLGKLAREQDSATCPHCQADAWDLDSAVFAPEKTTVGLSNAMLLLVGSLSVNVQEAIEEPLTEPHVDPGWIESLFELRGQQQLSRMLALVDERDLARLARRPGSPKSYRSPQQKLLPVVLGAVVGLAACTVLLASAALLFGQARKPGVLLALLLLSLAALAAGALALKSRARIPTLATFGLAVIPVVGPGSLFGMIPGILGLLLVNKLDAEDAWGPTENWRS